ncbi:MAG: His/Gly/Thr/Pro-type tRNA ligase C-terminal domain-containing protein [Candidatus Lokiarchaeota archaeon]
MIWGLLETANREIEHTVPGFKIWVSPIQVRILTIGKDQEDYAEELLDILNKQGYRTDFDDRDETLGKKIRQSEIDWIPYTIIVGDKEVKNKTISVRKRRIGEKYDNKKRTSKQINNITLKELLSMLEEDTKGFPSHKLPKPYRKFSTKISFRK